MKTRRVGVTMPIAWRRIATTFTILGIALAGRGPARATTAEAPVISVRELLRDPALLADWLTHHNQDVAAVGARVAQARADIGTARLWPNPAFDFTLGQIVLGQSNPPGLSFGDTYMLTFGLSQTFELGKRGPRTAAAALRLAAAERGQRDVLVQKAAEARLALARVAYLAAKRSILEESLASAERMLDVEKVRLQHGDLSGNDYDRLVLDTMTLRLDVARAAAEYDGARAACRAVLFAACDPAGASEREVEAAAPVPAALGDAAEALARRPDIRALALQRDAARKDAQLARRRVIPDPTVRAGYVYDRLVVAGDQPKTLMFTVTIPLPLFDRGQHDAARAEARAREAAATAAATLERARADLAGLVERRRFLEASLRMLTDEAVPKSARILATTMTAFSRGQVSLTDLLLARRTHVALLLNLMDLRFDFMGVRNELRRVLGLDAALAATRM
jgi:cobalt-zinc-cadmium efflux system outer membrane protein